MGHHFLSVWVHILHFTFQNQNAPVFFRKCILEEVWAQCAYTYVCVCVYSNKFFCVIRGILSFLFIAIRPKKHKGRGNSRQLAQRVLSFTLPLLT